MDNGQHLPSQNHNGTQDITILTKMENSVQKHSRTSQTASKYHADETPLEKILKKISRTHDFPSISKYLIEINQKLSANPDKSNAADLANVILKDYALTNKLLKLVNSAFYGLAAGKVTTVTRAVVVLGFDNIRLATLSLVLFEHFKSRSNVSELKETVISSFWAGLLARDIARMSDDIDPEEAFVCAMMSQLGKILMIYYQPDKHRKIYDRMLTHGESESKAAKAACGITYDELGMAVAKQWSFPPQIIDSMPVLTQNDLDDKKNPPHRLQALASFVKELGHSIQTQPANEQNQMIKALLERYQKRVKISKGQLTPLLKESLAKVQKHAVAMHFSIEKNVFLNRLNACFHPDQKDQKQEISENRGEPSQTSSFKLTDVEETKGAAAQLYEKSSKDIIMEGIQEISEAMMVDTDVNDIALMSLEVLYRALRFHRALMFVREGSGTLITVRYGYGHGVHKLVRKVGFKTGVEKDLFNLSIKVGKDLIVADAYDQKINELIPGWYRRQIDAPAFIFLPVLFKNVCIGAFYADRDKDGTPITEEEHRNLSMLRNQLILAIKLR